MDDSVPLSTLLSRALVAFTIEFDNEAEHRLPHRTTDFGSAPGTLHAPWLVSMAMWWNCMRFVTENGITVRELHRLARTTTNLDGMRRWGYIRIESRTKKPGPESVLRPTAGGRMAQEVWRPLFGIIETRWEERFGKDTTDRFRRTLRVLAAQLDQGLPDCMPILRYGLTTPGPEKDAHKAEPVNDDLPLAALTARALVALALEFEQGSEISLAIFANVLRVVAEKSVRVRDLPRLSGVSKEAIAMAVSFLEKQGYGRVTPETTGSKVKALALTEKGQLMYAMGCELIAGIEARWRQRFGSDTVRELREALQGMGAGQNGHDSLLFEGLKPYPENWRAAVRPAETLPHFPMVLHRGGCPDGS